MRRLAVAFVPLACGVVYLLFVLVWQCTNPSALGLGAVERSPLAFWIAVGTAGALWAAQRRRLAFLTPCLLAPLAVSSAWTVAPDHLGGAAFEGFAFFLRWLTRYPNIGPINGAVLLGIFCVLGASAVPAGFAVDVLRGHALGRRRIAAWLVLDAVAYLPVLIKLDALTVAFYGSTLGDEPRALFLPPGSASGAILRLSAFIAMAFALVRGMPDASPERVPPT
jgi:hypothetical protein